MVDFDKRENDKEKEEKKKKTYKNHESVQPIRLRDAILHYSILYNMRDNITISF